jgi:hypothetical protein
VITKFKAVVMSAFYKESFEFAAMFWVAFRGTVRAKAI